MKEAHKSQDIAEIDAAIAEMNTAWTAASEELYKGTQEGPQGAEGASNGNEQANAGKGAENVTDAEFEEVK